jgi:hypothetical protein
MVMSSLIIILNPLLRCQVKQIYFGLLVGLGLLYTATASALQLQAMLSHDQGHVGEPVTFTITATEYTSSPQTPDLSILEPLFKIQHVSSSNQIQIFNGQRTDRTIWTIQISPQQAGKLTVPAITIGSAQTEPLTLLVTNAPPRKPNKQGDDLFIELTTPTTEVIVQQQIPLTVRLYSALPLRGGSLDDPNLDGAIIERLDNDQKQNVTIQGRQYQVIERHYSISPEHSGTMTIPPIHFEGEAVNNTQPSAKQSNPGRNPLFQNSPLAQIFNESILNQHGFSSTFLTPGTPVHAQSQSLTLQVQPRPAEFSGSVWLPAKQFVISDSWSSPPTQLTVGEPIVRTLTFMATGLAASQIPEFTLPTPDHAQIYPSTIQRSTRTDGNDIYGIMEQQITLMPTTAGILTWPGITIDWWDINAKKQQVATIPTVTIPVIGGSQPATTTPSQQPLATPSQPPATSPNADQATGAQTPTATSTVSTIIDTVLIGLVVIAIMLGIWIIDRLYRGRLTQAQPAVINPLFSFLSHWRYRMMLRQATRHNNPHTTAQALLAWAQHQWPHTPPTNLTALATQLAIKEDALLHAFYELDRALYAPKPQPWQGELFWQLIRQYRVMNTKTSKQQPSSTAHLAPLYPPR